MIDIVFIDEGPTSSSFLPLIAEGDAAPSHRHRISATTADHDVESGVEITDHYRRNRDPLVLSIVISDSPLDGGDVELTRRVDAWALLERAADEALPAIVTTGIKTYEDIYLTEAATEFTAADGTWMRLELTFMPIRKVSTELVVDTTPDRDRRVVNSGAVATQDPVPGEVSLLSRTGLFQST